MRLFLIVLMMLLQQQYSQAAPAGKAFAKFDKLLAACSDRFEYQPETANLGPHQLGSHERDWSRCVYSAIDDSIIPKSPIADMYRFLITQHQLYTDKVENGEATRQQRRARMEQIVESIQRQEDALGEGDILRARTIEDHMERERQLRRLHNSQRDAGRSRKAIIRRF
jgi:hypothetical protein